MRKSLYAAVPLVALALLGAVLVARTPSAAARRGATPGTLVASRAAAPAPAKPAARAAAAKPAVAPKPAAKSRAAAIDGAALLRAECTRCHGLGTATSTHASTRGWLGIINGMSSMSSSKAKALASYLASR